MTKHIVRFFDKLEDKARNLLSHWPIIYAIIGGVAIVLFWRGVWMTADLFPFLTGPVSVIVSSVMLLLTGLFVSFFIGDRIILSGLKHEKKLAEKTEEEVKEEVSDLAEIRRELQKIRELLEQLKQ